LADQIVEGGIRGWSNGLNRQNLIRRWIMADGFGKERSHSQCPSQIVAALPRKMLTDFESALANLDTGSH
jgi:hypothetical protein